jgi:group I intron endonuclease
VEQESPFVIYKITSPSGRVYIGQTIQYEVRKARYSKGGCKKQPAIKAAISKYGWENMKIEIIHRCEKRSGLNDKEIELIKFYDSYENGYNCTKGGDAYDKARKNAKRKIRKKDRHARYKHTIFIFTRWRESLQIFVGTMYNFIHKYDLDRSSVSQVINGKYSQTEGWRFLRIATDKEFKFLNKKIKCELTARRKEKFWMDS